MKISTKTRYGLRILIDILQAESKTPRMIREISESQGISQKYVGRLIIALRNAGILRSVRGAKGGYIFKKKPEDVNLLEVVQAMEGKVSFVKCVSQPNSCKRSKCCPSRDIWDNITQTIFEALKKTTLDTIVCKELKNRPNVSTETISDLNTIINDVPIPEIVCASKE